MASAIVTEAPEKGRVFGLRTVISAKPMVERSTTYWRTRCEPCGKVEWTRARSLLDGQGDRCPACQREHIQARNREHAATVRAASRGSGFKVGRRAIARSAASLERVAEVLDFIRRRATWTTIRDVAMRFGLSEHTVTDRILVLESAGKIERRPEAKGEPDAWRALPETAPAPTAERAA